MPPVAVFDTNVLLSGVGWKGKPYECLNLARAAEIEAYTCQEILDELVEKLHSKLAFTAEQATETLADLLSFLRLARINGTLRVVSADPDDEKVLECSVVASATHIVTGDRRHLLPIGSFQGIAIVNPAEFLRIVKPT